MLTTTLTEPRQITRIVCGFIKSPRAGQWIVIAHYSNGDAKVLAQGGPVLHSNTIKAVARVLMQEIGTSMPIVLNTENDH